MQVQLPSTLRFESWWFEGGQRCTMHISYDTNSKLCTARCVHVRDVAMGRC